MKCIVRQENPRLHRYFVYPYKTGSQSARSLAEALGGKVLRREGSRFLHNSVNKKVVNWGASEITGLKINKNLVLNPPEATRLVSNKLSAFQHWSKIKDGPRIPRFWVSKKEAEEALNKKEVKAVVARTILSGHSGAGIVICQRGDPVPECSLYVEYISKDAEYRVHVFKGEVIDVQRKIRDPEKEPKDWKIRSHDNGFIFTRTGGDERLYKETVDPDVTLQAKAAVGSTGLDFGAVDILVNDKRGKSFVLEVNTAIGMEGATVELYANAIRKFYES